MIVHTIAITALFTFILMILPTWNHNVDADTLDNEVIAPPPFFDLRDVDGMNYVTSVKEQQGSTCWTFGTMASIESNLLMRGKWKIAGEIGEPELAEYHLSWWNGFNTFNNDDDPDSNQGTEVHSGGDYKIAAAYLSRGEGAVRDIDAQSYIVPPSRFEATYHYYYVRDIEWIMLETNLENIDLIKKAIMESGAIATTINIDPIFLDETNFTHYQPLSSNLDSWTHAIAVVGWDDTKRTQASLPGAWLCKNSWGVDWGLEGYFWVSYYDKFCCKELRNGEHFGMGAVSFKNSEPMKYKHIYYHDYHGWRDTMDFCNAVCNAFTAKDNEVIQAVSFYTADNNVAYTLKIYDTFENRQLENELSTQSGVIEHQGFHTIDLEYPFSINKTDDFFVYLELSNGGYPFDRTTVFLKPFFGGVFPSPWWMIKSKSQPGESYYRIGSIWLDLHWVIPSANFCIKCLCNPCIST